MIREIKLSIILLIVALGTVGCTGGVYQKEKELEEYNRIVGETLKSYEKVVEVSKSERFRVIEEVVEDKGLAKEKIKKRMSNEEKEMFKEWVEIRGTYYTGIGGDGVREVIFIKGVSEGLMYIEIIWGEEGVRGVEREIVNIG